MREERRRCPRCGEEGGERRGVGDLALCRACGTPYWVVEGVEEGRPVVPVPKPPPSRLKVAGIHLGVLLAEGVLAAAVLVIFVGLPVYGLGRLLGVF